MRITEETNGVGKGAVGAAGIDFYFVMAGLVPAIPTRWAMQCPPKRDARHKAGHDNACGCRPIIITH
jgi:hypothetical protein